MADMDIVVKLILQATDAAGEQQEIQSLEELKDLLGLGDDDLEEIRASGAALDAVLRGRLPPGILPKGPRVLNVLSLFTDTAAANSPVASAQPQADLAPKPSN